jgi:hypothetical protein
VFESGLPGKDIKRLAVIIILLKEIFPCFKGFPGAYIGEHLEAFEGKAGKKIDVTQEFKIILELACLMVFIFFR